MTLGVGWLRKSKYLKACTTKRAGMGSQDKRNQPAMHNRQIKTTVHGPPLYQTYF